jgi:metallo-beta-lactamase family protein
VVIVGFQAQGTPGRMLVEGARRLSLFGEDIIVRAKVHTLGGYSAHAGRAELLRWAGGIGGDPRFYLVHGEPKALEALREGLEDSRGITAEIPTFGQSVAI